MTETEKKAFSCPSCEHDGYEVIVAPRPPHNDLGLYRCGRCRFAFTDQFVFNGKPPDDKPN
jgi:hypothetical protein